MALLMGYKEYTNPWDIKNTPRQGGNPQKGIFLLISTNMYRNNDWQDTNLTLLNFQMGTVFCFPPVRSYCTVGE